jgi:hypothetical protein
MSCASTIGVPPLWMNSELGKPVSQGSIDLDDWKSLVVTRGKLIDELQEIHYWLSAWYQESRLAPRVYQFTLVLLGIELRACTVASLQMPASTLVPKMHT